MTWLTKLKRDLDTASVCRRYRISDTTLDRWLLHRGLGFPQPKLRGRRRFWPESELDAFDEGRASRSNAINSLRGQGQDARGGLRR